VQKYVQDIKINKIMEKSRINPNLFIYGTKKSRLWKRRKSRDRWLKFRKFSSKRFLKKLFINTWKTRFFIRRSYRKDYFKNFIISKNYSLVNYDKYIWKNMLIKSRFINNNKEFDKCEYINKLLYVYKNKFKMSKIYNIIKLKKLNKRKRIKMKAKLYRKYKLIKFKHWTLKNIINYNLRSKIRKYMMKKIYIIKCKLKRYRLKKKIVWKFLGRIKYIRNIYTKFNKSCIIYAIKYLSNGIKFFRHIKYMKIKKFKIINKNDRHDNRINNLFYINLCINSKYSLVNNKINI